MLSLLSFAIFCALLSAALCFQAADNKARNRFPSTSNLALGDVFVAINLLQDLLDNADLNKLNYPQVQSIRAAQFKLETAITAYAKQPEQVQ